MRTPQVSDRTQRNFEKGFLAVHNLKACLQSCLFRQGWLYLRTGDVEGGGGKPCKFIGPSSSSLPVPSILGCVGAFSRRWSGRCNWCHWSSRVVIFILACTVSALVYRCRPMLRRQSTWSEKRVSPRERNQIHRFLRFSHWAGRLVTRGCGGSVGAFQNINQDG